MKALYIDVCTNSCIFALIENDKTIIDQIAVETKNNLIDIINDILNNFLIKNNIQYQNLNKIYLVNGPGSFTGNRAGLNLTKTIISVYNNIKLYVIDTLKFLSNGSGLVFLDAKGNKSYIGVYDNNKVIINPIMINNSEIDQYLNQYKNLKVYNGNIITINNKLDNLINNLKLFNLIDDWINLEPYYIKPAL